MAKRGCKVARYPEALQSAWLRISPSSSLDQLNAPGGEAAGSSHTLVWDPQLLIGILAFLLPGRTVKLAHALFGVARRGEMFQTEI